MYPTATVLTKLGRKHQGLEDTFMSHVILSVGPDLGVSFPWFREFFNLKYLHPAFLFKQRAGFKMQVLIFDSRVQRVQFGSSLEKL